MVLNLWWHLTQIVLKKRPLNGCCYDHARIPPLNFTARCTIVQSAVLRSRVVCLSVCLSICLWCWWIIDHIRWKSWKLIARTISPTSLLFIAQRSSIYSQGNVEKFWGEYVRSTPMPYGHNVWLNWVNRESRDFRWRCGCLFTFVGTSHVIFAIAQLSFYRLEAFFCRQTNSVKTLKAYKRIQYTSVVLAFSLAFALLCGLGTCFDIAFIMTTKKLWFLNYWNTFCILLYYFISCFWVVCLVRDNSVNSQYTNHPWETTTISISMVISRWIWLNHFSRGFLLHFFLTGTLRIGGTSLSHAWCTQLIVLEYSREYNTLTQAVVVWSICLTICLTPVLYQNG